MCETYSNTPIASGRAKYSPEGLGLGLGGISSLKTVNTLQVAIQNHKWGDGPSKHEVHLQRCQESPREHMPHNRGISGHRRYPPKAHLDSLGCKSLSDPNRSIVVRVRVRVRVQMHQHDTQGQRTSA